MKIKNFIKTKAAMAAMVIGTLGGAFLMPVSAFASDGNGAVYVEVPEGWQNHARTLQVKVEDYSIYDSDGKEIPITYKTVYYGIDDGNYTEITDSMVVTIDHNCKLKLKALYEDGNFAFNEINIENFDLEQPTINATLDGEVMYFEATDQISGVADINVNGKNFTELEDGKMCANIKDLECTDEYISIHSDDHAGNSSKEYKIKNPYYVGEVESGQEDKSLDNPDSVEPTDPTKARGTVTDDFVTSGREFFTVDASGKTFYLIVDRTQNQENVYLLTEAGVNDLLNFVDYNGVDVQNGDVPMYEIPSTGKVTEPVATEETETVKEIEVEEEPKETGSNGTTMFIIIVLAWAGGIGYWFFKKKKLKDELDEAEEMDAFDVPDDIEIEDDDIEYEDEDDYDEDDYDEESEEEISDKDIEIFDEDVMEEVVSTDATAERYMAYIGAKEQ